MYKATLCWLPQLAPRPSPTGPPAKLPFKITFNWIIERNFISEPFCRSSRSKFKTFHIYIKNKLVIENYEIQKYKLPKWFLSLRGLWPSPYWANMDPYEPPSSRLNFQSGKQLAGHNLTYSCYSFLTGMGLWHGALRRDWLDISVSGNH